MRAIPLLAVSVVVLACGQRSDPAATERSASSAPLSATTAQPAAPAPPSASASGRAESAAAKILSEPTLAGAVRMLRPSLRDRVGEADPGTEILVAWARVHGIDQGQLAAMPGTTVLDFRKNPDAERGKRVCASGTLIDIRANGETHVAHLLNDDGVVTALAVGSVGSLAEDAKARFCGVAAGLFTYKTGRGEAIDSVRVVGSFDLVPGLAGSAASSAKPASSAR